ncbi:hypothetical protein BG004_007356 [Podila humilis]|nr:hypothetical protein BG004_007356 [Podila humilis]
MRRKFLREARNLLSQKQARIRQRERVTQCQLQGKAVDLPAKATKDIEKDPERRKLFELAWQHLADAIDAKEPENIEKETCLHFRDAFVALSGVYNIYSPATRTVLSPTERVEAMDFCRMAELDSKDEALTMLLDSLKTTRTRTLNAVLEDFIDNILNPHHGNKPSECDALLIWGSIIKDGRPRGTPFTFDLGEQASITTRVSKCKLACALDTGCNAHKCNCSLSIGKIQFGKGEAKRASTPPAAVKIQLRKNIKIARSVMLELNKFGLDCPPQLSIHGLRADVFRVMPWKRIYVAAPACDPIVLPTTEAAWNTFIEKAAHRLNNLLEYYHECAVDAKEKIDIFNYSQNTVGQDEEEGRESEGDPNAIELIDWRDVVFHTPTKPRAVKKIVGLRKPNNRRFERKMAEAIAKHEYDDDDDDNGDDDDFEEYDDTEE